MKVEIGLRPAVYALADTLDRVATLYATQRGRNGPSSV